VIGTVDRFGGGAGPAGHGGPAAPANEIRRHSTYTRVVHWLVALSFVLALLSGFALYTPWLFRALTPIFGGGAATRLLHPWFSLAFLAALMLLAINWAASMAWTPGDRAWLRHIRAHLAATEGIAPEDVGFFNAGQKVYFWTTLASAVLFLVSGLVLWFPRSVGPAFGAAAYVVHDIAALVMLVGFIVHLYEATAAQPGTFRAMTRGTVGRRWAWTHHPAWYREVTGRDARADYERARAEAAPHP
jgi:formate dehydrogenase subunit gamma